MPPSPKRKSEQPDNDLAKRPKIANDTHRQPADDHNASPAEKNPTSTEITQTSPSIPNPDSYINHAAALAYWSSTPATVSGVLGGYPQVSRIDLQGSSNFLFKLRRASKTFPPGKKLGRAVDCGAGIGRVTAGFLSKVAEVVDIVEPVRSFTDKIDLGGKGEVYNVGLEEWFPGRDGLGPYDLIWNQWCVGQLTDVQLVEYLRRLPAVLSPGGWIVVKENLSNAELGEDVFDDTDSSVTRTDEKFRRLFEEAKLKVVASELQKGMPSGLYPVRAYALQPR